jgi:hypothetical protein
VQVAKEIEMAAYWIGEHAITDPTKFEEFLHKGGSDDRALRRSLSHPRVARERNGDAGSELVGWAGSTMV